MILRAFVIWLAMAAIAVANGVFREAVLSRGLGDSAGHAASTLMLCVLIALLTWFSIGWIGPVTPAAAVLIGAFWVVLTVAFEFGFGHFAAGKSGSELLADYNLLRGRIWVLVLLTVGAAPFWAARLRNLI